MTVDELIDSQAVYVAEAEGMCVFCVLNCHRDEAKGNEKGYVVPIPVKYLREKGYTIENGYVYVDAPYGDWGVEIPDEYYDE